METSSSATKRYLRVRDMALCSVHFIIPRSYHFFFYEKKVSTAFLLHYWSEKWLRTLIENSNTAFPTNRILFGIRNVDNKMLSINMHCIQSFMPSGKISIEQYSSVLSNCLTENFPFCVCFFTSLNTY